MSLKKGLTFFDHDFLDRGIKQEIKKRERKIYKSGNTSTQATIYIERERERTWVSETKWEIKVSEIKKITNEIKKVKTFFWHDFLDKGIE